MTADQGYLFCAFSGEADVLEQFRQFAETTDRQNQFSHGLSWLDELDEGWEVNSEEISYDSIACTREFLDSLLAAVPGIHFEGTLTHSWPTLNGQAIRFDFRDEDGQLLWLERIMEDELPPEYPPWPEEEEDEEPEEIPFPTTPY